MNKYISFLKHPFPRINKQNAIFYSMMDKLPTIDVEPEPLSLANKPLKKQEISRAMKHHLEKITAWQEFMDKERHLFDVGKRHLANMMGRAPETFTQKDIDESIEYLFPCGLFEPKSRPIMKSPDELYPTKKEASFDNTGRPYHPFFYTGNPNFYQHMSDAVKILNQLNDFEDKVIAGKENGDIYSPIEMKALKWFSEEEVSKMLNERIKTREYENLINTLKIISEHPYASKFRDFFSKYTRFIAPNLTSTIPSKIEITEDGRKKITINDIHRKTSVLNVTAFFPGSGLFSIDGKNIHYFQNIQAKEMVLFPLIFSKMLKQVDIEAHVIKYSGEIAVAGGLRYGISRCLANFVDEEMREKMRLAGLLQIDYRTRERKKPGQWGARRKFTWKKR